MLRAVLKTGNHAYRLILACVMLLMFRDGCIEVLAKAMILYYTYSMLIALYAVGPGMVIAYVLNPQHVPIAAHYLERHDLGASVGMLILYKLFLQDKSRHTPAETMLLFAIMWCCNKRIELLAFVVAVMFAVFVKMFRRIRNLLMDFTFITIFTCCFVYIVLVIGGGLYTLAAKWGLDLSARINLFRSTSSFYDLSLTYMGRGFGFTSHFLDSIKNTNYAWKLGNAWMGAMHNDIVMTYIDIGTVGSALWFAHFLFIIPIYFRKHFGNHAKYVYWLMTVFAYVSYTMDNTMFYFMFQLTMSVIVLQGCWKSVNVSVGHRKMKGGIVHELQSIGTKNIVPTAGT